MPQERWLPKAVAVGWIALGRLRIDTIGGADAVDVMAGWLASRIDGPVRRVVGELKVELERNSETISLSRPQEGTTATLSRTGKPDALVPLARREARECLAEDMRRLDADEIYFAALEGINKVQYL